MHCMNKTKVIIASVFIVLSFGFIATTFTEQPTVSQITPQVLTFDGYVEPVASSKPLEKTQSIQELTSTTFAEQSQTTSQSPTRTVEDVTLQEILDKTFTQECRDNSGRGEMVDTTDFERIVKIAIRGGDPTWNNQMYYGTGGELACVYYGTKAVLGIN